MRHDTPAGYWPVRLLPLLAAALGTWGLAVGHGSMAVIAGLLLLAAAATELSGWGKRARSRSRALGLATLAGACVCALALGVSAGVGSAAGDSVVARR